MALKIEFGYIELIAWLCGSELDVVHKSLEKMRKTVVFWKSLFCLTFECYKMNSNRIPSFLPFFLLATLEPIAYHDTKGLNHTFTAEKKIKSVIFFFCIHLSTTLAMNFAFGVQLICFYLFRFMPRTMLHIVAITTHLRNISEHTLFTEIYLIFN